MLLSLLLWVTASPTAAAASPACVQACQDAHAYCAQTYAAGCDAMGNLAGQAADKALQNVPGGALFSGLLSQSTQTACEQKLAPCNTTRISCLQACEQTGAAQPTAQAQAAAAGPTPVLIYADTPGAQVFIDGKRAGSIPQEEGEPYTSPPLTVGAHRVRVATRDGRRYWEGEAALVSWQINSVEAQLLAEDEWTLAGLLAVEPGVGMEEIVPRYEQLAAAATTPEVRRSAGAKAKDLRARIAEAKAEAARQRTQSAGELYSIIQSSGVNLSQKEERCEAYLRAYEGEADTEAVRKVLAELTALKGEALKGLEKRTQAFSKLDKDSLTWRAKREEIAIYGAEVYSDVEDKGLSPYADQLLTGSGAWVPPASRDTVEKLWSSEGERAEKRRNRLFAVSLITTLVQPIAVLADGDPSVNTAISVLNVGAGGGMVIGTMAKRSDLRGRYGDAYPSEGRVPHAGGPLYLAAGLQLGTSVVLNGILDQQADDPYGSDDWVDEQRSQVQTIQLSGFANLGLGVAASLLRRTDAAEGAQISANSVMWRF
jgi:hypothetical protein